MTDAAPTAGEAADGSLTFVIPVRHHESVPDWSAVCDRLARTVQSVSAQTHPGWQVALVANRESPLPPLTAGVEVVRVDRPLPEPLPPDADQHARNEAIRTDKGHRVLAGLLAVRPRGHVMVVDFDDFVSRRLAAHVAVHPAANGWYVDTGFLFDGGPWLYRVPTGFNSICGTSLVVRSDLYALPADGDADEEWVRRWLGSHVSLAGDLATRGTPLRPLPFPGAAYRVGHASSSIQTQTVRGMMLRKRLVATRPWVAARRALNLRRSSAGFADEFCGGADPA